MNKKYEYTGQTKILNNRVLYRIRALRDFGFVKAGDLGGWIEKEDNLSHEGECWVANEAMVYDNARICDHALVCDNAVVGADVLVEDNAIIADDVAVFGDQIIGWTLKITGYGVLYWHSQLGDSIYGKVKITLENVSTLKKINPSQY